MKIFLSGLANIKTDSLSGPLGRGNYQSANVTLQLVRVQGFPLYLNSFASLDEES